MAIKISQLPSAVTLTGTELLPIVQGGVTSQITISNLFSSVPVNISTIQASGSPTIFTQRTGGALTQIQANTTQGLIGNYTNHPLVFLINNTGVMTLNASGNLLIGTTSVLGPGYQLNVVSAGNSVGAQTTSGASNNYVGYNTSGGASFIVASNGNVTNTNNSYGAISDVILKENIVSPPSYWAKYKTVAWHNFNLIADPAKMRQLGVVAQELQTVFPNLVETDTAGLASVKYSVLGHIADTVLQEAQLRIETLESQVTTLQARLTAANIA